MQEPTPIPNPDCVEELPKLKLSKPGNPEAFTSFMFLAFKDWLTCEGFDPKIVIAQSALETGWGRHTPGHNLFGIKSYHEDHMGTRKLVTTEVVNDKEVHALAEFSSPNSFNASVRAYIHLIKHTRRYRHIMELLKGLPNTAENAERYITAVHDAGYSTDPKYVIKTMGCYNRVSSIIDSMVN